MIKKIKTTHKTYPTPHTPQVIMNGTARLPARRRDTLAKLIASTHWFEEVKIDRDRVDNGMINPRRKSMRNRGDGVGEGDMRRDGENIRKVWHKRGGVQSWRKLVRMCNVLFTVKGRGIPGVASSVNRYTRTEVLSFFEGFRLTPGIQPLPEWEDLTETDLYTTVSSIMSFISKKHVCKKSAMRILVRPNGGSSYVFLDDVASALGLPAHQKMYEYFYF